MDKIITIPFGYILDFLYQFTTNYGVSLILFAIIVRLVMVPINAKSKKSMMKMSRLQPKMNEIRERYAHDEKRMNEALQQLQKEEGADMGCGGCLWSLVPLLIMFPLYQVVREPVVFMLHETAEAAAAIVEIVKNGMPEIFTGNSFYDQVTAAPYIGEFAEQIREAGIQVSERTLEGLNFDFLGVNLAQIPQFNIFDASWKWDWAHIGAALFPCLSAGSQVLSMWISQKTNNSVITDKNGVQDKETAEKSQTAQQTQMMMWMMPLMSLWFGFSVPAALSLYWFVGGMVSMIENVIMTNHYRKVYDAEDAVRLQRMMEREAEEAEKERIRAERRAANPEGQTQNTSKKKMQKKLQQQEEAQRAAAAREYAAKRGIAFEEEDEENKPLSGIPERPWCKGRAYDPDRYSNPTEE
ncbi:MAG: membrane protein insertase YidC [Oscillospiraceae bacterium]|nr:membrane protein insertase YidC [Oscillospiraceae bacterium]